MKELIVSKIVNLNLLVAAILKMQKNFEGDILKPNSPLTNYVRHAIIPKSYVRFFSKIIWQEG